MKEYKHTYQNNCFNAKLSSLLDKKRTIMDVDCFLYKLGCETKILFDHKKSTDKTTIASLKGYSMLASKNFHCYIVINDLDDKGNVLNNRTKVYEIRPIEEVGANSIGAIKLDYIKDYFILCSDEDIKNFFSVEYHDYYKQQLIDQRGLV